MPPIATRVGASGFVCLRGRVCTRAAEAAIAAGACDYGAMAAYVRRVVRDVFGDGALGAKFRVSDNDNADAAAFHRDAIRAPGAAQLELLTCIVYLDDAAMQVVPGSHVRTYGAVEALEVLAATPLTLQFGRGDVMVFHGELVHRAKLMPRGNRRRVIQIFDVVFRASDARRVAHVVSSGSNVGFWVARAPVIGQIARFVGFVHAMTGYGPFEHVALARGVSYLSSEGFSARAGGNSRLPLGLYCTLAPTVDVDRASIETCVYTLPQLRIVGAIVAAILAVAVLAWWLYTMRATAVIVDPRKTTP